MTKKRIIFLLFVLVSLLAIYFILNITKVLVISNNPTIANEPNIPLNSKTLSSNLIKPKRLDFIVYKFKDQYLGNHFRVHRLVAFEKDTVEIKKGVLFINGKNIDIHLNLVHFYKTNKDNYNIIKNIDLGIEDLVIEPIDSLNFKFLMNDNKFKNLSFNSEQLIYNKEYLDEDINLIYNQPWNKDNFGPLVVPKNKVFVIGDNRDYTFDSRNVGFIKKEDILGVILKIF